MSGPGVPASAALVSLHAHSDSGGDGPHTDSERYALRHVDERSATMVNGNDQLVLEQYTCTCTQLGLIQSLQDS